MPTSAESSLALVADDIARPLSIIFERPWQLDEVPKDGEKGNVTPVFKKGKQEDLQNYRLVSHTSAHGKVLEQIILRKNIQTH